MDLVQVFLLMFTYGAAIYVSFTRKVGTYGLGLLMLILSFFVLLNQVIDLSYNLIYYVQFFVMAIIGIISIIKPGVD